MSTVFINISNKIILTIFSYFYIITPSFLKHTQMIVYNLNQNTVFVIRKKDTPQVPMLFETKRGFIKSQTKFNFKNISINNGNIIITVWDMFF